MKKILVICPSRGRNDNHKRIAASFLATEAENAILCFALDEDDYLTYDTIEHEKIRYEIGPHRGAVAAFNAAAMRYANQFDILGVTGDDCLFVSEDWESQVLKAHDAGSLVISPADGLHNSKLPASYFVDSRIVLELGFIQPPALKHMCGDDFLLALGKALGRFEFLPLCMIEHRHPVTGKSKDDKGYAETHSKLDVDIAAFDDYMATSFVVDVVNLKHLFGLNGAMPSPVFKRRKVDGSRQVVIATPYAALGLTFDHHYAICTESGVLGENGYSVTFIPGFHDMIHRQRNVLASLFLETNAEFLVMVDSDMGFRGEDLLRMIACGLPVVGVNSPMRSYHFDQLGDGTYHNATSLRNAMLRSTIVPLPGGRTQKGMREVLYVGTGIIVIHRNVLETMIEKKLVVKLGERTELELEIERFHYQFFWCPVSASDHPLGGGFELGEDTNFCDLTRAAGFDVWCDPLAVASHTGHCTYRGTPRVPETEFDSQGHIRVK